MKAVAYLRVSTAAQGRSGLGLQAQRSAVSELAVRRSLTITAEFVEVESGSVSQRSELQKSLSLAKMTGAVLVIAKLDRLSRNAAFLLTLRDSGVRFLAADMPDANDLTIGIMAVIAQGEREAISRRTTEALAAVRQRIEIDGMHTSRRSGRTIVRLGNPNGSAALRRRIDNVPAVAAASLRATENAEQLRPLIAALDAEGVTSLTGIAAELNRRGILTPRRCKWHPSTVKLLLERQNAGGGTYNAAASPMVKPAHG